VNSIISFAVVALVVVTIPLALETVTAIAGAL
jgi:hypothetical protein